MKYCVKRVALSNKPTLATVKAEGFVVPVVRERQVYEDLPLALTALNQRLFLTY